LSGLPLIRPGDWGVLRPWKARRANRRMDARGGRDGRSGGNRTRSTDLLSGRGHGRGGGSHRSGALDRKAAGFTAVALADQRKASASRSLALSATRSQAPAAGGRHDRPT
jgi:hypothetical protein